MSKFTTVYNQIRSFIPTISGFSTKKEIPNPYSLEDNNFNFLKDSWGLKVGQSSDASTQVLCHDRTKYDFTIELIRELKRLDSDTSIINNEVLELMEDAIALKSAFIADDQLTITSDIEEVAHTSTSAVQFLQAEKFNFINVSIGFTIEIEEIR